MAIKKQKVKVKMRKARKRWLINPRTRIHGERSYRRSRQRATNRELIKKELEEGQK